MNTIDDRISAALQARALSLTDEDLAPATPPVSRWTRPERPRWTGPLLAAAVVGVVAAATVTAVQVSRSNSAGPITPPAVSVLPSSSPPPSPTPSVSQSASRPAPSASRPAPPVSRPAPSASRPAPSQPASSAKPSASASGSATSTPPQSPPPVFQRYQPLWPFSSYEQAEQWRTTGAGSQPWHLDPEETALNFTRSYLGFTDIDQVTGTFLDDLGAHVGVGYLDPNGVQRTAATLHLVQFGAADDAPWEVVGSDDTTLTLEEPAYGSTVTSPMTVGGHITGVDENIVVSVLQLTSSGTDRATLAQVPAGGDQAPWTTGAVSFTQRGVLTIVASAGGHLRQVERFAIHGVHT